jgi:hypothetical protein
VDRWHAQFHAQIICKVRNVLRSAARMLSVAAIMCSLTHAVRRANFNQTKKGVTWSWYRD